MIDAGGEPISALVFDTTCLSHFARADRIDVLGHLVEGVECRTTQVVRDELGRGSAKHDVLTGILEAEWLGIVQLDTLKALECFSKWTRRLGRNGRNLGESSVFAAVEFCGGTAITDDRDAVRVGRTYGLDVHGTVWLLASACRTGRLTEIGAGNLVDSLRSTGMRLPCTGAGFGRFAREHGVL